MNVLSNNFKMSNKKQNMEQLQTRIDTPYKTFTSAYNNKYLETTIPQNNENIKQQHISETQSHLYSREIVKNLMQQSKNKSIRHEINQIDQKSPLYSKPYRYDPAQFHFNNIPPTNPQYSSSCSNKIKTINEGLTKKRNISTQQSKRQARQNRKTASTLEPANSRVSISGLITYKFHSINARRSLGFNQINHQETMKKEIDKSKKLGLNETNRFKKILLKNKPKKYRQKLREQESILCNFASKTDKYLKQRIKQNEEQLLVYGQKAKKLHFIKDYMYSQKTDYNQGRHLINQIEKYESKDDIILPKRCKTEVDEDLQIKRRKIPVKRSRIKVRFLTFVD